MKQILQDLGNGTNELVKVPAPKVTARHLLIDTTVSLISAGTERMLVDFGRAGWIEKARQQPEKVRMVMDKVKTDGLMTTVDAVRSKLAEPLPLGYCNVGRVREVGAGADGFATGDRVVSNGPHADVVRVPRNLCAKIPDGVSDEQAAFTVVSAIGLQGIRLAQPTLGEAVAVTGTGLIGLLCVQILRAHGCRVLAIDFDSEKLALAKSFGAEICDLSAGQDPVAAGMAFSRGVGMDAVIVTASTKSSDPISQAANMCRKRGRIVQVGVTGLQLNRADFYDKELSFQVSCSYGPGRYDPFYEDQGNDYPIGFVRWTEQRNFEAVLDLMAGGQIDVAPLITHRKPFEVAPEAYDILTTDKSALGIMLTYEHDVETRHVATVPTTATDTAKPAADAPVTAFVGAGAYASRILIPAFKAGGANLHTVASSGGTSASVSGRRHGFTQATSDTALVMDDPKITTVAIATRHNSHAPLTAQALAAGKHVFVEKPLAITQDQLDEVETAYGAADRHLMVGFNRRFAPHIVKMKALLTPIDEPKNLIMTVNAGALPPDHWHYDRAVGGGRVVSEGCHFIDLLRHLVGAPIISQHTVAMGAHPGIQYRDDKVHITLSFEDGSVGTVFYLANGHSGFPKEQLDVFTAGRTLRMDNFRVLRGWGWSGFKKMTLMRQDKGQNACAKAFLDAVRTGGLAPIPADELFEVSRVTLEAGAQAAAE